MGSSKLTLAGVIVTVGLAAGVSCSAEDTQTKDTLPEEVTIGSIEEIEPTVTTSPVDPEFAETELAANVLFELDFPTDLAVRTGDDSLWFTERQGTVIQVRRSVVDFGSRGRNGIFEAEYFQPVSEPVIDLSRRVSQELENGLLGVEFSSNGNEIYLSYTTDDALVVSEFKMVGDVADPNSEREILRVDQPANNHNGGQIQTGRDGFLYIALGDGGDDASTAQDTQTLLGSILRIDPETIGDQAYAIPASNPFVSNSDAGLAEIWLYGVRNPWRFSFDSANGDLWIADVGDNSFEEINLLDNALSRGKGANLGWDAYEGIEKTESDTEAQDWIAPIFTYETGEGNCSVVGGHIYRGEIISRRIDGQVLKPLEGVYVYGDYCGADLRGLAAVDESGWQAQELKLDRDLDQLVAIGTAHEELYLMEANGAVSRLDLVDSQVSVSVLGPNSILPGTNTNAEIEVLPGDSLATTTTR